jgi:integrase
LKVAQLFLDSVNSLDRVAIDSYVADLKEHYKPGTVNFRFRVIRRLFEVNGLPWEYRRGEAPMIKQRDEYRPQLPPENIQAMIGAATSGKLLPYEACFLALSTTYGLRRSEIANLQPEDINLKKGSIYVATMKFGRERYHLIPDEIMPYIEAHDFNERFSLATMNVIFKRILRLSVAPRAKALQVSWHAVRRALWEGLMRSGLDPLAASKFMRWRTASSDMAMPARYYGNVVVDLSDENKAVPVLNEAKGDLEIFEKHPFLPFWREFET